MSETTKTDWTIGDRVKVGYFGQMRMGTVEQVGRTRLRVRVTMPSNRRVWIKWFSMGKCFKPRLVNVPEVGR